MIIELNIEPSTNPLLYYQLAGGYSFTTAAAGYDYETNKVVSLAGQSRLKHEINGSLSLRVLGLCFSTKKRVRERAREGVGFGDLCRFSSLLLLRRAESMKCSKRPGDPSEEEGLSAPPKKQRLECQEFEPRSYQLAVYEVALQRNTIAVLDTGSGKTMIAVMLIQHFGKKIKNGGDRRPIVFLAPTVHLVMQQYEEIETHTDLDVQYYCGARGVDEWNIDCWQKEVSTYQVMVMTPQVLLDALRKAFLTFDIVCLIIIDECHHAWGNHPYSRLMKEFYHKSVVKPHIFGMTASPVIRKGVASAADCEDQLSELELTLDSKIYTVADRSEMELFVPSAIQVTRYFDSKLFVHDDVKAELGLLLNKYDASVAQLQNSTVCKFKDTDDIIEASKKNLSSYCAKICHCLDELGLICAIEATKLCRDALDSPNSTERCNSVTENVAHCKSFLEEVIQNLQVIFSEDSMLLFKTESESLEAVQKGYISPKLYELLQIFESFRINQVPCLIFVERIITAKVMEKFMKRIGYLSHFTVSYLAGGGSSIDALTPKMQKETLNLFRSGKIQLLFTTDVAEEGIHVPDCSSVIRFDLPRTVRSYVQSCGRARQADSHYFIMLERGNMQQRDMLFDIIRSNHSMIDTSIRREQEPFVPKVQNKEEVYAYYVDSTGASVTADSSVNLINLYCQSLPRDKYYTPKPTFTFNFYSGCHECTLTLPLAAAIQTVVGPVNQKSHVAKKLACLEACKKLHQLGALDDHLLPCVEEHLDGVSTDIIEESAEGAGMCYAVHIALFSYVRTTKRKELHGTTVVTAMSGRWALQNAGITLQGYKFIFLCNQPGQNYSPFVLLIDANLDQDVACMEMDLYLRNKMVKAYISPCGLVSLDKEQVVQGKLFQEFFFNGLFGKLFTRSSPGARREFLLKDGRSLWNTSNMYMLLPLEPSADKHDAISINWNAISATASIVNFMRDIYSSGANIPVVNYRCGCSETMFSMQNVIHLANECADPQNLKNVVVLAIHTGRIYSVLKVVVGSSADSAFEGLSEKSSEFRTYSEYFNKKYGIVLQYSCQPLLLLKNSHNPHNLLASKSTEDDCDSTRFSGIKMTISKPQNHVHMPPELLVRVDVPLEVLKSFYLLPSLMYRIESLMLACQLRKEIAYSPNDSVSSILILEAITTQRCCEDFSLERLELLGDSVLKYAVSCHLFLKFLEKHEGQLSSHRIKIIRNSTLHSLGTSRGIQGYIRDAAFDPRRWVAPGQLSLHPVPCTCGVDDHDVPNKMMYTDNDKSKVIGKACDKGHRWICSKTISDCAEGLIGAYYVCGGLPAAFVVLKWLGIETEIDPQMVEEALRSASVWTHHPKIDDLYTLESKIGYEFSNKGLLLEAVTHASQQELEACFCYQRLEFLGDSVLDVLITWHLFQCYRDIDPGELTDLRLEDSSTKTHMLLLNGSSKSPKVLGDIVESIAGAILIDTKLDLNRVWEIFQPLLSPIVTPNNLELPPLRELTELCSHHGYFLYTTITTEGDMVVAILKVQLKDVLLVRRGCEKTKKLAKGQAAFLLLKDLEERGLLHSRYPSKRKQAEENVLNQNEYVEKEASNFTMPEVISTPSKHKEVIESQDSCYPDSIKSVGVLTVKMTKGGPRMVLYELCKKCKWPMPSFDSKEWKPSELDTCAQSKSHQIFVSSITLHIPNVKVFELTGERRADKKSSQDSAALAALYELEKDGWCSIVLE
ncbi:hypothetical protein ZIOFF_038477 [Zingiber officinale]|uniref:Dicer-like 3 n=1 Tax=Zingiber officinale TaxID=94328 RepID=A0A8J5FZH4_ZINOF|nr:hypothetical protein ZIOFF_038477 [Zingiber officinale]